MAGTAAKRFLRVLLALPLAAPLGGPSTSALTARAGGGRPPYERVVDARTVATVKPVRGLSADGQRVAFTPGFAVHQCGHVAVWTPQRRTLTRFDQRCDTFARVPEVALAGARVAWVVATTECSSELDPNCWPVLETAVLGKPGPVQALADSPGPFRLRGHGDLLVFSVTTDVNLVRIGMGREECSRFNPGFDSPDICTTIRTGAHSCCADSVSDGLIALREPDAVAIVDADGKLVRVFPFGHKEVSAARLDGGKLVVARVGVLQVYDVHTGASERQRPLPAGHRLLDVDGGVAVLKGARGIVLLRLADGRSYTLPNHAQLADLEAPGLYYSYATASGEGRVVFVPRAAVARRLGF